MAKIGLRAYTKEIDGLIDRGQYEHALAHCRYILKYFPKHTDTYRLMAKAYLESQRYGDASDVFQRVLSSIPDDFVSHLGMSIIREDEGNLDAAIWHMERAFEIQPANSAIQNELRRLYGRRDGIEPPKVRLTRGALARMYFKGELYPQAISELRGALSTDPQRPDLQLLLAKSYYRAGFKIEAADTCTALLKKLPYCIEANIILAEILEHSDRREEAQNYRKRAISLNPYLAQVNPKAPTPEQVPDNAIIIEKLDWTPDKGVVAQPQWAESLGVSLETGEEGFKETPDWLTDLESAPPIIPESAESDLQKVSPFIADEGDELPFLIPEQDKEKTSPEDLIPDWMKEAGWAPSSGDITAAEMGYTFETQELGPEEEQLAPAELPSWLQAIAPPQISGDEEEFEQIDAKLVEALDSGAIPWFGEEEKATQAEEQGAADVDIPDWLTGATTAGTAAEIITAESTPEEAPAEEIIPSGEPEIVVGFEDSFFNADTTPETEIPDWLIELSAEEPSQSVSEITPESEPESIPGWLESETAIGTGAGLEMTQDDETGLPLSLIGAEPEPSNLEELSEIQPTPTEEMPEWLIELGSIQDEGAETALDFEEMEQPTYLSELEQGAELEQLEEGIEFPQSGEAELPEWLLDEEQQPTAEVMIPEGEDFIESDRESAALELEEAGLETAVQVEGVETDQVVKVESISPEDEEAAFAWLEGLAAKQGASEALLLSPEEWTEEPPDWVQKEIALAADSESVEKLSAEEETLAEIHPVEEPGGLHAEIESTLLGHEEGAPETSGVPAESSDEWILSTEAVEENVFEWNPEEFEFAGPAQEPYSQVEGAEITFPEMTEAAPDEILPEWLRASGPEAAITEPEPTSDILPSWLSEMEKAEAETGEAIEADWQTEAEAAFDEEVEWFAESAQAEETQAETIETDKLFEWLSQLPPIEASDSDIASEQVRAESFVPTDSGEERVEEWELYPEEAPEPTGFTEEEPVSEWRPESLVAADISGEGALEQEEVEGLPEWLEEPEPGFEETPVGARAGQLTIEEPPVIEGDTQPARLARAEVEPSEAGKIHEPETASEPGMATMDEEAAFAWLEGLAVKQGATEDLLLTPEERLEEPPEWIREATLEETVESAVEEQQVTAESTPAAEEELEPLPEWLVGAEAVGATSQVQEAIEEESQAEEVTPPLSELQAEEMPGVQPAVSQEIGIEEALLPPSQDIDAAYAWLESLAARQGAEEALILPPEERIEEAPAWVQEEAETARQEIQAEVSVSETRPTIEETLEEAVEEQIPENIPLQEEALPELPSWLAAMEEEATLVDESAWTPPMEDLQKAGFVQLDINRASLVELERLPGVGFRRAQAIIAYRESQGSIHDINELTNLEGFDDELIVTLSHHLVISQVIAEPKTPPETREPEVSKLPIPIGVDTSDLLYKARTAINASDISTALAHYQELIRGQEHLPEVIQDLQLTLKHSPHDFTLWVALGDAQMRAGHVQEALESYNRAEELIG